ncbi:MAG: hypothetical protein ISR83_06505 [Candidatus Marinimicrobia bacterium]|nr:hypothetical protein [Candidatus Neomarinimicrobiota bacterium]
MNKIQLIFLSLFIFSIGCESVDDQNIAAIEAELLQVLDRDDALGIDGLDDQNAMESDYDEGIELDGGLAKMAIDTLWPGGEYRIRFGRRILDHNREVDFVIDGDTAIGNISFSVEGEFRILAIDTATHEVADSVVKSFTSVFNRKVRFVQHETPNNPDSSAWRVDAFTMGMGGAGDKVAISSLSVFTVDFENEWSTGELLYSFNADEAGDLFLSREDLPTFNFRQPVILQVEVANLGPEFPQGSGEWTHFHYARSRFLKGRRHLNDGGSFPDVTENDNTFSAIWRVHGPGWGHNQRIFRGFFDVLDMSSVFVEDEDVHTAVWWFPYKVSRP